MEIVISNSANTPIYEQIYTQIKNQIINNTMCPNEMLPSIRSLAKDLRISVITTKRAYDELERDGYIYTVSAKGSYVSEKNTELIKEEHLKQIEAHIEEIARLANILKIGKDEIEQMLKYAFEEDKE